MKVVAELVVSEAVMEIGSRSSPWLVDGFLLPVLLPNVLPLCVPPYMCLEFPVSKDSSCLILGPTLMISLVLRYLWKDCLSLNKITF